jgi:hypothetical protein
LRQLVNEESYLTKDGHKRRLTDSNSISVISNRVEDDEQVIRFASKVMFYQTTTNTPEKIGSIFQPFLKAWARSCNLQDDVSRIFSSTNGDSLLDATISVYNAMQDIYQSKSS